jgi:putative membrane protein
VKWPAALALLAGAAATAVLLATSDPIAVWAALSAAGWGVLVVIVAHLPSTFLATLGWRSLIVDPNRPPLPRLFALRWIKEAVNALLPVAQVGGDVVRVRLLLRSGVALRAAAASCTVDVAAGVFCLFVYMTLGLVAFLFAPHDAAAAQVTTRAIGVAGLIAAVFVLAPRLGLFKLVDRLLARVADERAWAGLGDLSGLHRTISALYADRRRLLATGFFHGLAWSFGTVETFVALRVLGVEASLGQAFVIDSLGQAVRAAGFAIPGALGVQEGGYVLVCGLFGIPPQQGLALSVLRRIREAGLGLPGLLGWARLESRRAAA